MLKLNNKNNKTTSLAKMENDDISLSIKTEEIKELILKELSISHKIILIKTTSTSEAAVCRCSSK